MQNKGKKIDEIYNEKNNKEQQKVPLSKDVIILTIIRYALDNMKGII